jgi:DNA repair protein SbcC/Rad50
LKILRVKVTNLNSLRGTQEVDFEKEPLAGAGLFAITGPTGAGKSTLLDAITLALYGKAARYGSTPSPEDMMSRHCGECAAEVLFRVPKGTYRAEWQLRRARGKADGTVQPPKRYVYDLAGQPLTQKIGETEELMQELIGLDYPRFLRSALLAQGEFAQFLKAKPDDRAALLESLTGTGIYSELGRLAHTETSRREQDLEATNAAVREIKLLPDEQRQKLLDEIPQATARLEAVKGELHSVNELLNKAINLASALEQERAARHDLQALTSQRQTAEPDLQRLARHRTTVPFQGDIARLEAAEAAAATAQASLDQANRDHAQLLVRTQLCLLGYRRMLDEQLKAATTDIDQLGEKIRQAEERKKSAENWLQEHKSDKGLTEQLTDLVSELTNLKNARKELERAWDSLGRLVRKFDCEEANELQPTAEGLSEPELIRLQTRFTNLLGEQQKAAASARKKAEEELHAREDHLANARLVASFEEHRSTLTKGEPCPLCGALDHPFAEGKEPTFKFADLERRVKEAKQACQKHEKECNELVRLATDLEENGSTLQSAVGDCARIVGSLANTLRGFSLPVPSLGREADTRTLLEQRDDAYRKHVTAVENAGREQVDSETRKAQLKERLAHLQDKQSALADVATLLPIDQPHAEVAVDEPLPRWQSLAAAENDWADVRNELCARGATLEKCRTDQQRATAQFTQLRTNLSTSLQGSNFAEIDDLKSARLTTLDASRLETLESQLNDRAARLDESLKAATAAVEKWRTQKAPEAAAVDDLKARQNTLQGQHDQFVRELALWKNDLTRDDENRHAVAHKQKDLESDRQRLQVWQRLCDLIGSYDGRSFRRFAQGISLDVLVHYANRHLGRLSDRYRLRRRLGEELDLEIEDLHQAGAVRPMASLSGGESFLGSLALALGLSDIAGRNVRIESLFIDEGFGSLDSDTLDLAISALETLRQDNKTVGVISHVDLLKERIATQIVVEKKSGGTSTLWVTS